MLTVSVLGGGVQVYTWYPPSCTIGQDGCTEVEAYNRNTMHWMANPVRGFMGAMVRRQVLAVLAGVCVRVRLCVCVCVCVLL